MSKARSPAATALRRGQAKGFAFGERVFAPFDVAVGRAFAETVALRDVKIGAVFAPVCEHHQKLVFDAKRVGFAASCLLLAFGGKKRRAIASNVPLRTPVSCRNASPFSSLTDSNLMAAPFLAATNQTVVKKRLCKRSISLVKRSALSIVSAQSPDLRANRTFVNNWHRLLRIYGGCQQVLGPSRAIERR
jgi:hypothetical protein